MQLMRRITSNSLPDDVLPARRPLLCGEPEGILPSLWVSAAAPFFYGNLRIRERLSIQIDPHIVIHRNSGP